jgi:hypothetical protein
LFVKGAVGAAALALPLVWTLLEMTMLAQNCRLGRMGLSTTLLLIFYSFGENLEALAYLYWPGLVILGSAFGVARLMSNAATPPLFSGGLRIAVRQSLPCNGIPATTGLIASAGWSLSLQAAAPH